MRKRIEEVGGEFHLSSIRDEGTCVRIRVPH